jgi:hypothetical protein
VPIVTPTIWMAWSGKTFKGPKLASLGVICTQVDQAIKTRLRRTIEYGPYDVTLDGPFTPQVSFFRWAPVERADFKLWFNAFANGDPTQFTDGNLLTPYIDYILTGSLNDPLVSDSGVVTRVINQSGGGVGFWSNNYYSPVYSVAQQVIPTPGAIRATFVGGYKTIPADLQMAACFAVSLCLQPRELGVQKTSESWNGYSYGTPIFQLSFLDHPNVGPILDMYQNYGALM